MTTITVQASHENRLASIDTLLTWMVGTNIVITLGVLWRLLYGPPW